MLTGNFHTWVAQNPAHETAVFPTFGSPCPPALSFRKSRDAQTQWARLPRRAPISYGSATYQGRVPILVSATRYTPFFQALVMMRPRFLAGTEVEVPDELAFWRGVGDLRHLLGIVKIRDDVTAPSFIDRLSPVRLVA